MKYTELAKLAKNHGISINRNGTNELISGNQIFYRLIDAGVIPYEFFGKNYHSVSLGDLGFYAPSDGPIVQNDELMNDIEIGFGAAGAIEFLKDLFKIFKDTDYVLDEYHVKAKHEVTATVVSKSDSSNKLHLRATIEGWLIPTID